MEFLKRFNIQYDVFLNSEDYNDQFKENLEVQELNGGTKASLRIMKRSYIELIFRTDSNVDYIHPRGNLIELYKNQDKIIEIQVSSKELINIEKEKNTFIVILYGNEINAELTFRSKNYLNERINNPNKLESVFNSNKSIRYHFVKATDEKYSNNLIIVFSAFSKEYTYNYNYIDTLKDIPVNKLFILDDFGSKGSYYLGAEKDFSIENSVLALILNKCAEYNIPLKNITTLGSSKGGYSALYFGVKYSFGHIITLAPSLYLGSFLKNNHPDMLDYILGNRLEADEAFLNNFVYNIFKNKDGYKSNIRIMVGTRDSRKETHINPFIKYLDKLNYPYEFDLVEGVDHSQLKYFAPEYFKVQLTRLLDLPKAPEMYLTEINFRVDNNIAKIDIVTIGDNLEYAFYWYCDNIVVKKVLYSHDTHSELPIEKSGDYRSRVFLRNTSKEILTKSSHTIRIDKMGGD